MKRQFLKELGTNTVLSAVVFGWIFSQTPLPDQAQQSAEITATTTAQKAGKRPDQIPSVQQASIDDIKISIEPTAAPAPLPGLYTPVLVKPVLDKPGLDTQTRLLKVVATNLKLRTQPSSQSESMQVYPNGTAFAQIGQDGDWLQVRHIEDGTSGWMHGAYLQASN